jgi:hypothetical protein
MGMDTKTTDQIESKNLLSTIVEGAGILCAFLLILAFAAVGVGLFMLPFSAMTVEPNVIDSFQAHALGF